jgi:hypothetical protein
MDPYLPPTFSFEINIAEQVFHFLEVERERGMLNSALHLQNNRPSIPGERIA